MICKLTLTVLLFFTISGNVYSQFISEALMFLDQGFGIEQFAGGIDPHPMIPMFQDYDFGIKYDSSIFNLSGGEISLAILPPPIGIGYADVTDALVRYLIYEENSRPSEPQFEEIYLGSGYFTVNGSKIGSNSADIDILTYVSDYGNYKIEIFWQATINGMLQVWNNQGNNYIAHFQFSPVTKLEEDDVINPVDYILEQNFPNPFNPVTTIRYQIPSEELVTLTVYDILGNKISTLINDEQTPGRYEVFFEANNLASGIYYYTLITEGYTNCKKMVLIK